MEKYKTIGVLGGMGPEATICFYSDLVKLFQKVKGAVYDSDFPKMIIINIPLPDIVEGKGDKQKALEMLLSEAKNLEKMGAEIIIMPCNSAHIFEKELKEILGEKFLSIVESVKEEIGEEKTLLLSTKAARDSGIYRQKNIKTIKENEQNIITQIIINVLAGRYKNEDKKALKNIIGKYDIDSVILGCTELPIILSQKGSDKKIIDTTYSLAKKTFYKIIEENGSIK